MNIEVCEGLYTKKLLRVNPNKVYVYGDNMKGYGKGGQAIIRDEPNAFGIPTKRYPSKDSWAYFSDKEDERMAVIVFPSGGIGTGLALMSGKSPKIFDEMNGILKEFFGFDNGCL